MKAATKGDYGAIKGIKSKVLEAVMRDLKAATEKKTDEDAVEAMNDVIIDAESILGA